MLSDRQARLPLAKQVHLHLEAALGRAALHLEGALPASLENRRALQHLDKAARRSEAAPLEQHQRQLSGKLGAHLEVLRLRLLNSQHLPLGPQVMTSLHNDLDLKLC